MKRRWTVFVAALAGTAVLAIGLGYAADRLVSGSAAPRLTSVPASTLNRYGISLAAASAPPYCGPLQAWGQAGLLRPAGCPITRQSAEAAAARVDGGVGVVEALLARVTSSPRAGGLSGRLAWVVVVRGFPIGPAVLPKIRCSVPVGSPGPPPPCILPVRIPSFTEVVILDASSGQVLTVVGASGPLAGPVGLSPMRVAQPRSGSAPVYTIPPVVKD